MDLITSEFEADLSALLEKHKIDKIGRANMLGQWLGRNGTLGVDVSWSLGGMLAAYAIKHDAAGIFKRTVEAVEKHYGAENFNYNDLDCDMWAKKIHHVNPCLECDCLLERIRKTKKPRPEVCPRCNSTKLDPESFDEGWFLVWNNHGNAIAFVLWQNCINYELHIRELPYNKKDADRIKVLKALVSEVPKGRYDTEDELIRYRDTRDKGFLLSMVIDKEMPDYEIEARHSTEANPRAVYALESIVEHFPCVLDDIKEEAASNG